MLRRWLAMMISVALGFLCLFLLLHFISWRGRIGACWLGLAGVLVGRRTGRGLWAGWVLGLLLFVGTAPSSPGPASAIGCVAPFWLRFSAFNWIPEQDMANLGIALFFPGHPGIRKLTDPVYAEMAQHTDYARLASAVHFSAFDLFGLGTGSGHLYYFAPKNDAPAEALIFIHGAMGNLQCYLYHWQLYAQPRGMAVVCPTFGFGSWYRPGGTETAANSWRYAQANLPVKPGPALIIGMSNGATGAVRLAAAYPEMVGRLVLISPVLETDVLRSKAFLQWAQNHPAPLVLMGDADRNVSPASVERGVAALESEGVSVDYRVFHGHDHFLMFSARDEIFKAIDSSKLKGLAE